MKMRMKMKRKRKRKIRMLRNDLNRKRAQLSMVLHMNNRKIIRVNPRKIKRRRKRIRNERRRGNIETTMLIT